MQLCMGWSNAAAQVPNRNLTAAQARKVLAEILAFAAMEGFGVRGLVKSSLKGPKGNVEFLVHLAWPGEGYDTKLIDQVMRA